MKIGIFGDVHANLEALTVVLDFLKKEKVDKIFCLGDIVGYNANPKECIQKLWEHKVICISGNHDRFVSGEIDAVIRPETKQVIDYTKEVLSKEEMEFLSDLPDEIIWEDIFMFVHGSPRYKDEYINSLQIAKMNLQFLYKNRPYIFICFYGHTHLPYVISNEAIETDIHENKTFKLNPNNTYLINPGSVGQPRDQCPLSSFIILDIDEYKLSYYRISYDIELTQRKIKEAGFSDKLAERLAKGR